MIVLNCILYSVDIHYFRKKFNIIFYDKCGKDLEIAYYKIKIIKINLIVCKKINKM